MIKIAEVVPGAEVGGTLSRLVAQAGVEDAVGTLPPIDNLTSGGGDAPWDYLPMLRLKDRYDQAGFDLGVIEWRPPLNLAKRGLPGRDEEIAAVCTMITNMGRLGIPVWCYEWMTDRNWVRTSTSTPSRAGSVVTAFDRAAFEAGPPSPLGEIGEEQLWENLEY
ncbi:MAG TPA: mannonate dehydratase, partial [Microlunatus sp.]|nr:mannonate dehydratase [Microlunatus sp.]